MEEKKKLFNEIKRKLGTNKNLKLIKNYYNHNNNNNQNYFQSVHFRWGYRHIEHNSRTFIFRQERKTR